MFVAFQGNYKEAGRLYERSLDMLEKALGPDHPEVAESLRASAELLKAQVKSTRRPQSLFVVAYSGHARANMAGG